ncbi:hypothetical protein KKE92_02105 [Candidatus Micrarchaeota archaeon]|nr:hypothetical protein [Candidatus Micrarchaeota archaeon]
MSPFSPKSTKGPKSSSKVQKKTSKLKGELQSRGMSVEDLAGRDEIDDVGSDLSDEERSQVLNFLMNDKSSRRPSKRGSDNSKDKKQDGKTKSEAPKPKE